MTLLLKKRLTSPDHSSPQSLLTVPLHWLAHGRTGDKGNRSNISVIAYRAEFYPVLVAEVTEERVAHVFAHRRPTAVTRFLLPKLHAMNFVIDDVLDGGVNSALNLDTHGKSLAFLLLDITIQIPASLAPLLPPTQDKTTRRNT